MQSLRPYHSYTHSGSFFAKMLLLWATLKQGKNIAHIIASPWEQKTYSVIAAELWLKYYPLESYHDLELLSSWSGSIYSIIVDDIHQELSCSHLEQRLHISLKDTLSMESLMKSLQDLEYQFSEYQKPGSYNRLWDQIKIFFPNEQGIIMSFWWDEIESIEDLNWKAQEHISLMSLKTFVGHDKNNIHLSRYLQEKKIFSVLDSLQFHHFYDSLITQDMSMSCLDIIAQWDNWYSHKDLKIENISIDSLEVLKEHFIQKNSDIKIYTRHETTIREFLKTNNFWHIQVIPIKTHLFTSFCYTHTWWKQKIFICDDILAKIFIKKRLKRKLSADVDLLLKIKDGDYVVHIDHGIWIFQGIIKKQLGPITKEYLEISYKENDKLFVPITQVHRVSKYIGSENPHLTPLCGKIWEKKMQKVHEDIREIAQGILKNFAERKLRISKKNILSENEISKFQSLFPYPYTPDQESAIKEIFEDMQSDKNMDRLLVGDVGFWKTEVAFNAAYAALVNKKQVLLISPLVVLAHEHYSKSLERFKDLWYNIEVLTRLQSQKHATRVMKWLADGSIDMVVWTHRLLSEKLACKKLWLMIVDEEHKFWVVDKEKIKNIKSDIDILSLSATPIPRSLNLALSGVRNISLLKTPPGWRKSIDTSVARFNETLIQNAWKRELDRGGQIFFVHNRVSNIEVFNKKLEALFPKKKVIITHGQLPGDELENRILDFKNKKYDILLSTTVIENGIDFSNVNTIFINECQQFWISQIHQLRGRVGRSNLQGYCYLLYRKEQLDSEAAKRIQTIVNYSYLGAGFELAMKDLEIRWWGDILGVRQSGQAKEIGVSLFLKMLEEKIEELKQEKQSSGSVEEKKKLFTNTNIDLMISAGIPDSYFLSETDKLNFYREIELVQEAQDLQDLKDSFFHSDTSTSEKIPIETHNLFSLLECQILSGEYNITHIKKVGVKYQIQFHEKTHLDVLKSFLSLDKQVLFSVIDATKIRCSTKGFENDIKFIEYLLQLLQGNISNPKIKLIKKVV